MKLRSTYTKIFLSFLAVLFITEVLVFFLFIMLPARHFAIRFDEFVKSKVQSIKGIAEGKILSSPDAGLSGNTALKEFITDFGRLSGAQVWLTGPDGRTGLQSFSGEPPDLSQVSETSRPRRQRFFRLYAIRDVNVHTLIPLTPSGRYAGDLHILFKRPASSPPKGLFALGLLVIGTVVALAAIPVSRLITRRIRQLRLSAALIAEGDLSHRVVVRGKDEISNLAGAFNDMAEKVEAMLKGRKELTANISHELRAPLTRIRIAEELVREKAADGVAGAKALEGHLDAIREDIDELDVLIGRILDLSKLDMGQTPLRPEALDPSELIRELMEKFRPVIERKGLRVAADLSRGGSCLLDKETLRLALMNVLDNSIKFCPDGGDISAHVAWKPDATEIRITNTAEELSREDLSRIFDPFHRLKQSAAAGSGLGLTIAKKAVERLGGTIEAAYREGGLEIIISLPRQ
ncbi:MAG TPA: HAMP domain-containing sensor histidine kinase [Syntrophorhabdaceae bacterium]